MLDRARDGTPYRERAGTHDVDFIKDPATGRFEGSRPHGYGLVPGDVEKFKELKSEWAKVNNTLLAHVDNPDGPEAKVAINKLEDIVKEIQKLKADPGGPAGIGLPGGPVDVAIVGAG